MRKNTFETTSIIAKDLYELAKDVKVKAGASGGEMAKLAPDFQPGSTDVICRRGKSAYDHNEHFRVTLQKHLDRYSDASTKLEKSLIVSDIVDAVRTASPNGGFVRKVNGIWVEVGDNIAREKVGGTIRDMLHLKYKSATKSKRRRRQSQEGNDGTIVKGGPDNYVAPDEEVASHDLLLVPEKQRKRQKMRDSFVGLFTRRKSLDACQPVSSFPSQELMLPPYPVASVYSAFPQAPVSFDVALRDVEVSGEFGLEFSSEGIDEDIGFRVLDV